jgi:hypothetical protein
MNYKEYNGKIPQAFLGTSGRGARATGKPRVGAVQEFLVDSGAANRIIAVVRHVPPRAFPAVEPHGVSEEQNMNCH